MDRQKVEAFAAVVETTSDREAGSPSGVGRKVARGAGDPLSACGPALVATVAAVVHVCGGSEKEEPMTNTGAKAAQGRS